MSFAWHREDYGYFAAIVASAAVVLYVLIGNFGLLPSPFSSPANSAVQAAIDPVLATELPDVDLPAAPTAPPPASAAPVPVPPVASGGDRTAPAVTIKTPPGTSVSLAAPGTIEGTVADTGSGVKEVMVTFVNAGMPQDVRATLACPAGRSSTCTWSARIPAAAGTYTVTAKASDIAGNSKTTQPVEFTVVNGGGAVGDVTDTVDEVPETVEQSASSLLTNLLNFLN